MKSPRTYVHPDIQTDRQTEFFFGLFCLLSHTNHEYLSKGENFFFSLMRLQYFLFLHTPYEKVIIDYSKLIVNRDDENLNQMHLRKFTDQIFILF